MAVTIRATAITGGRARGQVLFTDQPISFWGGLDMRTGDMVDPRHPLFGQPASGRVLAFPQGKGSCTAPLVLLELMRIQKAPAALVLTRTDPILATAPIVAGRLYGWTLPIVNVSPADFALLATNPMAVVDGDAGRLTIE